MLLIGRRRGRSEGRRASAAHTYKGRKQRKQRKQRKGRKAYEDIINIKNAHQEEEA